MTSRLNDIDTIATESREQYSQKLDPCHQRREEKLDHCADKEAERQELANLVNSIMDEREQEKQGQGEGNDGEKAAAGEILSEYILCSFLSRL